MALPATVTVKISSEAAESISVTEVVGQEMAVRELVELILPVTGKDAVRVREILLRGSFTSGASRFRWLALDAEADELGNLLAGFPDSDPGREFRADLCVRVFLCGPHCRIELSKEAAERRGWFQKSAYWGALMPLVRPTYVEYSYKARADLYRSELAPPDVARLRDCARLLRYSSLTQRIRAADFRWLELHVERPA